MKPLHHQFSHLEVIVKDIVENNGRAYVVGGAVRDTVLCLPIKDIDVEVHGLSEEKLKKILQQFGHVSMVGKSFGVFKIAGIDVDWSLPRTDSAGRKPIVTIDPFMLIEKALLRRDLTMNAMAIDIMTHEFIDPFDGLSDIKKRVLRTPDKHLFVEDPLRFFRVMQFVSRFAMFPDQELDDLCKTIDITAVSRERIEQEFNKLLLLSKRPSLGIRWLKKINRLREILPELFDTIGIEQSPLWHPEGDVFEHAMQALDAAAIIAIKYDDAKKRLVLLWAALCHDLGKVTKTTCVDGVIKSIGHECDSKIFALKMMKRITHDGELIASVACLVLYHMMPLQFVKSGAKLPAYKRLARKLENVVSMSFLADLCLADKQGRNGASDESLTGSNSDDVDKFIEKSQLAGVLHSFEQPVLSGADLLGVVNPGPKMGALLAKAYDIQINQGITDKQELLRKILGNKR